MPISFAPLWKTMEKKGFTTYDLKAKLKIGGGTYNRLKAGQDVSTHTIGRLCDFLDCEVFEIIEHIKACPQKECFEKAAGNSG